MECARLVLSANIREVSIVSGLFCRIDNNQFNA